MFHSTMTDKEDNKSDEEYKSGEEGNGNKNEGKKEEKKKKSKGSRPDPNAILETCIFVLKTLIKKFKLLSTVLTDFQPGSCSESTVVFHQSRYDDLKKRFEDQSEQLSIACSVFGDADTLYEQHLPLVEEGEKILQACNERLCALQKAFHPVFHTAPNSPLASSIPMQSS